MKTTTLSIIFSLCFSVGIAQQIEMKNLKKHIFYLSSDQLEGRATGTKGEKLAADYVVKQFKKYNLTPKGLGNTFFQPFYFSTKKYNPHDSADHIMSTDQEGFIKGMNIIGWLDNQSDQTIVIGAHMDHIGKGEYANGYPKNKGKIHNGADDNASGVAGVLELARYFSENKIKEKYNFLFIAFSGEELGLYGSKFFCSHPTINLSSVDMMLNMDMIGRLDSTTKKLVVYGICTSPTFSKVMESISTNLKIKIDSSGVGPSDHTSFYLQKIPVLHFFTGQHTDYHQPTDDEEKINYEGEKEVLNYIVAILEKINKEPKLIFTTTKVTSASRSFKVTLGIMPDYTFDGKGLRVDAVTEGKPASNAGIKRDDVIIKMGSIEITTIQDYMHALSTFEKGQVVDILVNRKGEEKTVQATF